MRINLLVTLPGSRCLYNPYAGVQKEGRGLVIKENWGWGIYKITKTRSLGILYLPRSSLIVLI